VTTSASDTSAPAQVGGNVSVGGGDGHPKQLRQPQHQRDATMQQQHPQSAVRRQRSAASDFILVPPGLSSTIDEPGQTDNLTLDGIKPEMIDEPRRMQKI